MVQFLETNPSRAGRSPWSRFRTLFRVLSGPVVILQKELENISEEEVSFQDLFHLLPTLTTEAVFKT